MQIGLCLLYESLGSTYIENWKPSLNPINRLLNRAKNVSIANFIFSEIFLNSKVLKFKEPIHKKVQKKCCTVIQATV